MSSLFRVHIPFDIVQRCKTFIILSYELGEPPPDVSAVECACLISQQRLDVGDETKAFKSTSTVARGGA